MDRVNIKGYVLDKHTIAHDGSQKVKEYTKVMRSMWDAQQHACDLGHKLAKKYGVHSWRNTAGEETSEISDVPCLIVSGIKKSDGKMEMNCYFVRAVVE